MSKTFKSSFATFFYFEKQFLLQNCRRLRSRDVKIGLPIPTPTSREGISFRKCVYYDMEGFQCSNVRTLYCNKICYFITIYCNKICYFITIYCNKICYCGSCCGSVGKAVASYSGGLWFESSHRQKFIVNIYCQQY